MTPKRPKSPRRETLDWWTLKLWELYRGKDTERSPEQMWLSVVEYASKIAEDTRKAEISDLPKHLAHAFAWIASFVAKCNNDPETLLPFRLSEKLSDIVAFKYPGKCGICEREECTCTLLKAALEKATDKKLAYARRDDLRKEFSKTNNYQDMKVHEWVNMFQKIYKEIIQGLPLEHIAFHFMEEVGEVADAMTTLNEKAYKFPEVLQKISSIEEAVKKHEGGNKITKEFLDLKLTFAIEIADCFSWWCSLYLKMEEALVQTAKMFPKFSVPKHYVDKVLKKEYELKNGKLLCPNCKQNPCACSILI